jgi:hypothetical protein
MMNPSRNTKSDTNFNKCKQISLNKSGKRTRSLFDNTSMKKKGSTLNNLMSNKNKYRNQLVDLNQLYDMKAPKINPIMNCNFKYTNLKTGDTKQMNKKVRLNDIKKVDSKIIVKDNVKISYNCKSNDGNIQHSFTSMNVKKQNSVNNSKKHTPIRKGSSVKKPRKGSSVKKPRKGSSVKKPRKGSSVKKPRKGSSVKKKPPSKKPRKGSSVKKKPPSKKPRRGSSVKKPRKGSTVKKPLVPNASDVLSIKQLEQLADSI